MRRFELKQWCGQNRRDVLMELAWNRDLSQIRAFCSSLSRIICRRPSSKGPPLIFRFDRFQADDSDFRLLADGAPVSLEPKAFRLLPKLI